ncbi:hypothetical protein IJ541_00550 [bacterium]|nr:hypothetical protein [bacterium]
MYLIKFNRFFELCPHNDELRHCEHEQSECVAIRKNSYRNNWIASSDLRPPRNDRIINKRNELIHLSTYPPIHFKRAAFTLAETLITLGIIGVVSALTIPGLVQEYAKKSTVSKLKQTYSELNQVIKRATVDYDDPSGWEYGSGSDTDIKAFVDTYIAPYVQGAEVVQCTSAANKCNGILKTAAYMGINGTGNYVTGVALKKQGGGSYMWYFYRPGGWYDGKNVLRLRVYVNNPAGVRRLGTDVFTLQFNGNTGKFLFPGSSDTREYLLFNRGWGGNCMVGASGSGYWAPGDKCLAIIVKDGWKISKDYPWRR